MILWKKDSFRDNLRKFDHDIRYSTCCSSFRDALYTSKMILSKLPSVVALRHCAITGTSLATKFYQVFNSICCYANVVGNVLKSLLLPTAARLRHKLEFLDSCTPHFSTYNQRRLISLLRYI